MPDFPTECTPRPKGTEPLSAESARPWAEEIPNWILGARELRRERVLPDFRAALSWIDAVGEVAEAHGHHPDIHLTGYKHVELVLSTHSIGGLSPNDFVVAKAIDALERL